MGFFDDILKKIGASLATRYAVVVEGNYAGCHLAMGNPPKEKVTVANRFPQVIFLKDKEEVARLNIAKDVVGVEYNETIQFAATGNDGFRCTITYADGETSVIDLFPSKLFVFYSNFEGMMDKETSEFLKNEVDKRVAQA